jgi:hypothetical protein
MIGEDDVFHIAGRTARHVACRAVIAVGPPRLLRRATILSLMTAEALAAEISRLRGGFGRRMRIVAGGAPQFVAAGAFAGALLQVLHMARHSQLGRRSPSHEDGKDVGQKLPWRQRHALRFAGLLHTNFAGQVALSADASRREQAGRIHHLRTGLYVIAARAMAPLARHAVFEKWRSFVSVQRSSLRLNAAGMAR